MIDSIVIKLLKTFVSEDHILGLVKKGMAALGVLLINNGLQTGDTWTKWTGLVSTGLILALHFVQTHNKLNTPKA